ncbi:HipA N-terminal domain-containing protein [Bacteroidales bacterium OttesenSCG-928-K03]|nr:HipA N-terminal domain-containing protein [Odoribacter sp. OttesenSCG-928-L07]MDL2243164.1 HipA N-terminal domain-containing protein [Bacteroidales bacterium OttesenSCG-928-K03]
MRKATVHFNEILAGTLTEISSEEYVFEYLDEYFVDSEKPAISLTFPKIQQVYKSKFLFPFFFNMLSEGNNRITQARSLHIDEKDDFGILLATAYNDTIGAITVKPITI